MVDLRKFLFILILLKDRSTVTGVVNSSLKQLYTAGNMEICMHQEHSGSIFFSQTIMLANTSSSAARHSGLMIVCGQAQTIESHLNCYCYLTSGTLRNAHML